MLAKSKYLFRILISLVSKKTIQAPLSKWIDIRTRLKEAIWTKNISKFLFNTTLTNFFILMSSTYLIVDRALAIV